MLIDSHLDLAWNAGQGRDLTQELTELRRTDPLAPTQTATVTFPELAAAGLRVAFGTLFALPQTPEHDGYVDHAGARAQALAQLAQYERWQEEGWLRLLRTRADIQEHLSAPPDRLGVVLLMEGADPVSGPDDLAFWQERGVRLIGPAWGRTRHAGGTDAPGPLTPEGRELVQAMRDLGLTLDASHLDDAAFWDAAETGVQMVSSHANARALVPGNRQLSDEMARHIVSTGGVLGLVVHSKFARPGWRPGNERAPLSDLVRHAEHFAALVGWEHLGLGSDLDGGFGAEKTPAGIDRYRDLTRFLDLLPQEAQAGVRGENWQRWLLEHLFSN
ncbi:dipeptidase [Deinococcus sp. PESE-13]